MSEVNACIITIGDELLIGQTVDTNSAFIGQELNKIGIWVKKRIAIGDIKEEIMEALRTQSTGHNLIIMTGGLGPTADDITKPTLCEYFGGKLVENADVLEHVKNIFSRLNRPLIARNLKQAEVPDNCIVLHNQRGTAPGMWFEKEGVVYISLPGVPHEMTGLVTDEVIPRLLKQFQLPAILHRTALTIGQGESFLADLLTDFEASLPTHIKLAYLPNYRAVKLRLTAKGENRDALEKEVDIYFHRLQKLVKEWLVADEDITIVDVIGKLLDDKKKFLATAESCTGGHIAHLITTRAGASGSFKGGVVTYANDIKENILEVKHATLAKWGAVSEETVTEMVTGVLELMNADYALATSGVMGPEGGTKEKPVGTVWMAVANRKRVVTQKYFAHMDRKRNIEMTALMALNMLRKFILEEEGES